MPDNLREIAAFIPWLCVSAILMYKQAWLPGVLCLLSGVTYPVLLILGLRIEYLGLVPIIADAFLIAALGFWGLAIHSHTYRDRDRISSDGAVVAVGMAKSSGSIITGKGMHHALAGGYSEIKAANE